MTIVEKIAMVLNVSSFSISNPILNSYVDVMHALFYLEKEYVFFPDNVNEEFCLKFKDRLSSTSENIESWYEKYQVMQNTSEREINNASKHYEEWKSSYPRLSAERTKKVLGDKPTKKFKQ